MLEASWLSDITGINLDLTAGKVGIGTPRPEAIPQMLQNLPKDIGQTLLAPHGQALATLIRQAYNQARARAVPIPPEIAAQLSPFYPSTVIARAMWAPTNPNSFSLDTLRNMLQDGAITLDNIIVFSDSSDGDSRYFNSRNPEIRRLWAHELTHVMQYTNMGIESFATIYSVDWESLESQARSWANQVEGRLEATDQNGGGGGRTDPGQSFYFGSSSNASSFLRIQDYTAAARQFYPPASCIASQQVGPQQLFIQNVCPVPVYITGSAVMTPPFGQVAQQPCFANCGIAPGFRMPFVINIPGQIVNVFYRY